MVSLRRKGGSKAVLPVYSTHPPEPEPESTLVALGLPSRSSSGGAVVRNCRLLISVSLIGIVSTASILAFGLLGAYHDQENKFTRAADDLLNQFENVVKEYATAGLWIHEACRTRTKSQEDFRTLYDYLVSSGLEFQAVSFAMNVSHAERPIIEEDTRNFLEGGFYDVDYEGFVGLEMDPSTGSPKLGPRSDQPLYHTVHYVEPFEDAKNRAALDFDLRTSALRWTAVEQAIAT
jgi:CHASE1-domain containing sensor protein